MTFKFDKRLLILTRCEESISGRFPDLGQCPSRCCSAFVRRNLGSFSPLDALGPVTSLVAKPDITMSETIKEKLKNYKTAPFDARFPNQNQTRNCYQNYLDFYRCTKALNAKGVDPLPCEWYQRVYKSMCPMSWIQKWDEQQEAGTFAGNV